MRLSPKAHLGKALAIGTLAAAAAFVAPAKANAQGFGVAVQFGNAFPVAYGQGYDNRFFADPFRHEEWRRHEEWCRHEQWVRQEEWLRHQEWERSHLFYGRPPFAPGRSGDYGR